MKSGIGRVLAVVDAAREDSEVLACAATLCRRRGARLFLLSVLEPPRELGHIARTAGIAPEAILDRLISDQRQRLEALAAAETPDLSPEIAVRMGKPFIEIIREGHSRDCDLVIKTAEPLPGLGRFLLASTDQHLLRKCPCPVWLRQPQDTAATRTILAAVDVDTSDASEPDTLMGLNKRILETAIHLAEGPESTIHLLHVWDAPGESLVRHWAAAGNPEEAAHTYTREVRSSHWQALTQLAEDAATWAAGSSGCRLTPHLERGTPREMIPKLVETLDADMLVMGTIARTGLPGFIIGNTAEDVLNSVACSVVTIKPPAYVSPVIAGAPAS